MVMRYRTFDHTADLGIEVYGEDQNQLFSNAGFALFDLITEADKIEVKTSLDLTVEEMNLEDLMVNWLRELLYLHQSERYLFRDFIIHENSEKLLRATLKGEKFDPLRHELIREIKAVTYHQIKVAHEKEMWVSRIVFDI
jgi:SHS2 domain-containing protein